MKILNVAAGKMKPLDLPNEEESQKKWPKQIVNIDTSYYRHVNISRMEKEVEQYGMKLGEIKEWYCNTDIFQFMERTTLIFDRICIYRFLEHVSFTQVNYFLYLVSTVLKRDGYIDVIVPNYRTLAKMILAEDINAEQAFNFEGYNILLTTELLNEPSCPHASIWTKERVNYFVELEGRFKVEQIDPAFHFDGRDIYIRFIAKRI